MQGQITVKEIERYSRHWSGADVDRDRRLLLCAVESEVLAQQCISHDLIYEASQLHLARLRLLCELSYSENVDALRQFWEPEIERLHALCANYSRRVQEAWVGDRDLVRTWFSDIYMTTYPVECARIMELASLAYFTANDTEGKERLGAFVRDFVQVEIGCAHPISDRFAVSLILASLVLIDQDHLDAAASLLERATVWLCDRYEEGHGLSGVEADEQVETNMLLGYPFEFINVPQRCDSLLATALMDLAAFLKNADLYSDIVNDVKAVTIYAEYWQPRDTVGACLIEGQDVLHYPNVEFADTLPRAGQEYAEHLHDESDSFRFVEAFGPCSTIAIMALLRDRYFPKIWPRLVENHLLSAFDTSTR